MFDLENQDRYSLRKGKWKIEMSPFCLKWIEIHLKEIKRKMKRETRLMEFGSGLSTVWYGKCLPEVEVCSVEGDKKWYKRVKRWLKEENVHNVNLKYVKQDANYRLPKVKANKKYIYPFEGSWDIIINDGGIRETIGVYTMDHADDLIRPMGVYFRHDYERAIKGDWIQTGADDLYYDQFCGTHNEYELITVSGNGMWGYIAEMGGIWRKPSL